MIAEGNDQFMWWAHEKSKVVESGKIKGLNIMTGFTNSQKLSWMNNYRIRDRWLSLFHEIQGNWILVEIT
jgi:hypothetical protein